MNGWRWSRLDFLPGILFVVLFVVAFALTGDTGDTAQELAEFYAEGDNRAKAFASFFLFLAGMLAFLWFLGALRAALATVEPPPGRMTPLAFGSGLVSATLLIGAISTFVAPAGAAEQEGFEFDANAANVIANAGYAMFVAALVIAALFVAVVSSIALRTAVLPRWLAWLGLPVAVVMLFSIFFFPLFVFLAWVLVVSVVMLLAAWRPVRPGEPPRASAAG
jgi:hypothetical protein